MKSNDIIAFFVLGTLLSAVVAISIIVLLIAYKNRHDRFVIEQEKLKAENENKVLIAKIESQEVTMGNLSMELHDNISQLLYLAQTNIKVIARENPQLSGNGLITATAGILETTIQDVQNLGKSLNGELMKGIGLVKALQNEIAGLQHGQLLNGIVSIEGTVFNMPEEKELMIFRIAQEAIHNALKHADANLLTVSLVYSENTFQVSIMDNGKGFIKENIFSLPGMGMLSMHHRTQLIGGNLEVSSVLSKGTTITLSLARA